MTEKRRQPDFSRWAITGVVLPAVVILILSFFVLPRYYDEEIVGQFGFFAWMAFVIYLLCLCVIAALWKWRLEKNEQRRKTVVQSDPGDVV